MGYGVHARRVGILTTAGIVMGVGTILPLDVGVAEAAEFTSAPERLYMVPDDVSFSDLQDFAANAAVPLLADIPIGSLEFGGGDTDPISGDPYKITVDTVDGNAGCDLTQSPYDDDDCSRLQLSGVQSGRISMGAISTIDDGEGPGLDVHLLPSGARIDNLYQVAEGSYSLGINGTPAQLQAALDDLVYTPDDGYYYADGPNDPEVLNIIVVPGNSDDPDPTPDPKTTDSIDIEIRVLRINGFPSHDGPASRTAQPDVELKLPAVDPPPSRPYPTALFTVADADNDESIDADTNDPGELPDGANSDMMLIGSLDCGASTVLDDGQHGFHFRGGTFQSDDVQIKDFFEQLYDVSANPDYQLVINGLVDALDAIDPDLSSLVLATSSPFDYTTAFAGVADMATVEYALSQVSFRHHDPGATCELITVVLDLGNNGLPLQYVGSPPTGIEVPFIGFDWNVLTLNVDQPEVIDISFDPEPIFVLEGNPAEARMLIESTPSTHPEFQIGWEANPKNGEPVVPGQAEADVDFAGTYNNSPVIPADVTEVTASVDLALNLPDEMAFPDSAVEGIESFEYRILPDAYDPPPGYAITASVPTRTVYILDEDDAARKVLSFVGSTTLEGDPGDDQQLTFEVTLDDMADGNESFDIAVAATSTADGADHGVPSVTTVAFDPGQESAIITVPITEDLTDEADDTVILELSNFQNMDASGPTEATGTIQNDDAVRTVTIDDVSQAEGNAGTSTMTFTVSLDLPAKGNESVTASTFDDTATDLDNDYEPNTQMLSFADGETSTSFDVTINGDTAIEPTQTFDVVLASNVNLTIADSTGIGTITNDDGVPATSIDDVQIVEGDAGTTNLNFTVSLSAPAIEPSTVMVTSTDVSATAGSDFGAVSELVSFDTGEDSKQVSVSVTGDTTGEFDETFTLDLSAPSGVTIADGSGSGTITNDDLDVSFVPQAPVAEGAPASIVVGIFPPIHPEVSVGVVTLAGSATAGTDYITFDAPVTILPDAPSSLPVAISTNPDFDFEPDEQFTAILTPGLAPGFTVRWDGVPAMYTIVDDDPQSVVSIADGAVVEGGGSNQATISMTNVLPTRVCNVALTSTPGSASAGDFTALTGLAVAADALTEVVSLVIDDDAEVEGAEDFTIAMTLLPSQPNCLLADAQSTVTIVDNDDPAPSLSIADASVTEGTGAGTTTISFALTTSGLQAADCGFRAVVTHGTTVDADFVSIAAFDVTAVFDTNDVVLNRTFEITRDVFDESDETFTLTITGDGATPCVIGDGVATGTIIDDDAPLQPLSIADASVVEGTGGAPTTIDLNVTAAGLQPADCGFRVVVTHVSTNDADFESTASFDVTAVFDTDDVTLPRSFGIVQDANDETNETFAVTISGDGANPCPIADGVATGTILDDDGLPADDVKPTVIVEQATVPVVQDDPTSIAPIHFTVTFDEDVTGFVPSDLSFAGSTAPGTLVGTITGSGPYNVAVEGMTGSGLVVLSLPADRVSDLAGNTNTESTSVDNAVQYNAPDLTKPTVTINEAADQDDPTAASPILFTVVFSEPVAGFETDDVTLGGSALPTTAVVTGSGAIYSVAVSGMSTGGAVTASIGAGAAVDAASNTSLASTSTDNTVTYAPDTSTPVTIDVPDDITTENDPGKAGAVVVYDAVTTSGGVPPVTVDCTHDSGDFYPLGTTVVTCTATDSSPSGDIADGFDVPQAKADTTVSASFSITVVDTEPPTITVTTPNVTGSATSSTGSVVTYATPPSSDNSGASSVTCTPPSGSLFKVGTTTVTCTASDAAGNTSTASFVVTVSVPTGGIPATGSGSGSTILTALLLTAVGVLLRSASRRRTPAWWSLR